jgi:hypothetical protein
LFGQSAEIPPPSEAGLMIAQYDAWPDADAAPSEDTPIPWANWLALTETDNFHVTFATTPAVFEAFAGAVFHWTSELARQQSEVDAF